MLRFINDFPGLGVVSLVDGRRIAVVNAVIINPHNLSIAAFVCQSARQRVNLYLVAEDIRTINQNEIIVNDENALTDLGELLRLRQIVEINYQVVGKSVRTDLKRRVGIVTDCAVDDGSLLVEKIYVRPSLVKFLRASDQVIGRQQIIEVGDKQIVVKDATVTERAPAVEDATA